MSELSASTQDYLKVIWTAQEWTDNPVTTTALAARLGLSVSAVSDAVKRLTAAGLVAHARYGSVELTEAGRAAAVAMVRKHRLIETFLVEYLGYGWDEVHDEAEVLEHAVSDEFVDRLGARLGDPQRDPHGDPIPARDGRLPELPAVPLASVAAGERVTVARVSDHEPDLLRYLASVGLVLDAKVEVVARREVAGTIDVRVHPVEGIGGRDRGGGVRTVSGDVRTAGSAADLSLGLPAAAALWVLPAAVVVG